MSDIGGTQQDARVWLRCFYVHWKGHVALSKGATGSYAHKRLSAKANKDEWAGHPIKAQSRIVHAGYMIDLADVTSATKGRAGKERHGRGRGEGSHHWEDLATSACTKMEGIMPHRKQVSHASKPHSQACLRRADALNEQVLQELRHDLTGILTFLEQAFAMPCAVIIFVHTGQPKPNSHASMTPVTAHVVQAGTRERP